MFIRNPFDEIEDQMARNEFPEIEMIDDLESAKRVFNEVEEFLGDIENTIDILSGQIGDLEHWRKEHDSYYSELEDLIGEMEESQIEVGDRVAKDNHYGIIYTVVDIEQDIVALKYYPYGKTMYTSASIYDLRKVD